VRTAVVAAAVGAVAVGALTLAPGQGQSAIARATAALTNQSDSILHVVLVDTHTGPDGTSSTQRIESWGQTVAPFGLREIQAGDGRTIETATVNGQSQIYDPQSNTVYTSELGAAGPPAGKQAPPGKGVAVEAGSEGDRYKQKILGLLASGNVREDGHVTVDGRDAIRIVSSDGTATLAVDASTFEPIEWSVSDGSGTDVAHFPTYERLPGSDTGLLDLTVQHPSATVDSNPADYQAAVARIGGKIAEPTATGSAKG
jgi:hypothetical protein